MVYNTWIRRIFHLVVARCPDCGFDPYSNTTTIRYAKDCFSAPLGLGYKVLVQFRPAYAPLLLRTYFDVPVCSL